MELIDPWLDAVEVRRLAESLMKPSRRPVVPLTDAGFDEGFMGYTTTKPAEPVPAAAPTPAPAPAPVAAPVAAAMPEESAVVVPSPIPDPVCQVVAESFSPTASGLLLARIHYFRDWMRREFTAKEMFILDWNGEVVFDESHHGRLHFLARGMVASHRPGLSVKYVHIKIRAGATLEVIPVETHVGRLVLGAVVPEPLPAAAVTSVMDAIILVASA